MTNKNLHFHDVEHSQFWLNLCVVNQHENMSAKLLPAHHAGALGGNAAYCEFIKRDPHLWLGVDSGNPNFLAELDDCLSYTALDDDADIANLLTSIETGCVGCEYAGQRPLITESQE